MRWILALMLCLLPFAKVRADGPNDQFVEIYTLIQQADTLNDAGQKPAAADKYLKAQSGLKLLQGGFPTWNKDVVQFRLDYVTEKLGAISKAPPVVVAPPKPVYNFAEMQQKVTESDDQIAQLKKENASLERKLKEALSVQPAAIDPQELVKAEARITALQKDKDLLAVSLDQEKTARVEAEKNKKGPSTAELSALRAKANKADDLAGERDSLRKKLDEASKKIALMQSRPEPQKTDTIEMARLKESNAVTEKKLADAQKELDALRAAQQDAAKTGGVEVARLKESNAITERKLEETRHELDVLKAGPKAAAKTENPELAKLKEAKAAAEKKSAAAQAELDRMKVFRDDDIKAAQDAAEKESATERDNLKKKLSLTTKDLAEAETRYDEASTAVKKNEAQLKSVKQERDALATKLKASESALATTKAAPSSKSNSVPSDELAMKNAQLQARLAVFEANPIPYTAEELALFKKPATKIAQPPTTVSPPAPASVAAAHKVHSIKDLPPGAGSIMAEGQRAFQSHEYDKAEKKYREVLRQDDQNVYVLSYLATAQFANGEIDECEKTVSQVMALDPNNPAGLYLMGNLRMRQGKLDEALDALSRSAQINPTNSVTQNSLGTVLSQKGQRKAAETALRKALMTDPDYADAHHNLAIVYATENPPSMELARLHYKKSIDLGHPRDSDLEKLLDEKK